MRSSTSPETAKCSISAGDASHKELLFIDRSWILLSRYPDFYEIYVEEAPPISYFRSVFYTRVVSDKKTIGIFAATRPQAKWLKCELGDCCFASAKSP
ncbi:UTRA domain-containing protein [Shigella boydii]